VAYIGVHVLVYVTVARNQIAFRSERLIFLYHALPFAGMSLALFALSAISGLRATAAPLVLSLCLLSLYSMSFLELWAISDGSIYFRLLCRLARINGPVQLSSLEGMQQDGKVRRDERQTGLVRLRLMKPCHGRFRLTMAGRPANAVLRLIAWTVASP
jgi:hypothetical protein